MPEVPQHFFLAIWGNIARNQNKLQMALIAHQIVAPHDQKAGAQHKSKQKLRRLNNFLFFHEGIVALATPDRGQKHGHGIHGKNSVYSVANAFHARESLEFDAIPVYLLLPI